MTRSELLRYLGLLFILLIPWAAAAIDPLEESRTLNQQAVELHQAGKYQEAIPLAQRALEIKEKVLGPEHPSIVDCLLTLAGLHKGRHYYSEALPLYWRALEIREKALGPEHPEVAGILHSLLEIFDKGHIGGRSGPNLYNRVLAIKEKALGPEHPEFLFSLHNLARAYHAVDADDQALDIYQRLLKLTEKTKGAEHPETAHVLECIASTYVSQSLYYKALPLYQQSLQIYEKALGPAHRDTANILNSLGEVYEAMCRYEQALPLYQRALQISEKIRPQSLETSYSLNNLARIYRQLGIYDQAFPLLQRTLSIREKGPIPKIMDMATAETFNNLAVLYMDMGAYDQALVMFQRALETFDDMDPNIDVMGRMFINNLGVLSLIRQDYHAAEVYFRQCQSIPGLVELALAKGQFDEALKLLRPPVSSGRFALLRQIEFLTQQGLALAGTGGLEEAALAQHRAVQELEDL